MKHYILTTHGTDGAASAALLLMTHPKATILRTSSSRVAETLTSLSRCTPGTLHICGAGISVEACRVVDALKKLRRKKFTSVWYCGRGYLDDWADALRPFCKTVFENLGSNAEAVQRALAIPGDSQVDCLVALGQEYAAPERSRPESHQFWHDLVHSASTQYFRFDDEEAFLQAIRKLAGLVPVTKQDKEQVLRFHNTNPRAVPLGSSPVMRSLRKRIQHIAPIDEPVLILGPSGAGKELVAWLLHEGSPRRDGPFVPVNCAILSTSLDLAQDRLFGHVAGAYTGAKGERAGAFELADGGTLFLDEVAELPLEAQTQLLRVLEENQISPVGSSGSKTVDVRLVAATNQKLPAMIRDGRFRLDLYHRLNVLRLDVPALKERREDMQSIAASVAHGLKDKGYPLKLDAKDWEAADNYSWPGNVRQFINMLKRAAYMQIPLHEALAEEVHHGHEDLDAASLNPTLQETLRLFHPLRPEDTPPVDDILHAYMSHVLDLHEGNWTRAAKAMGVAVNTVRKHVLKAKGKTG